MYVHRALVYFTAAFKEAELNGSSMEKYTVICL